MSPIKTVLGKYIFLDIVGYSYKRTVEAQTDIINVMNGAVTDSLKFFKINEKNRILIPTGDGICVALLDINNPYDIHMQVALKILELIDKYNKSQKDEMRKFMIRVGVNENTDNLIIDVNGNRNVAGAGITEAQRIMDQGNAANIFVGRTVYSHLCHRENYLNKFKGYPVVIKHKQKLDVYQFLDPGISYLNSEDANPNFIDALRSTKNKVKGGFSKLNKINKKTKKSIKEKLSFFKKG